MDTNELVYEAVKAGYCKALGSNPDNLLTSEIEAITLVAENFVNQHFYR